MVNNNSGGFLSLLSVGLIYLVQKYFLIPDWSKSIKLCFEQDTCSCFSGEMITIITIYK